MTLYNRHLSPDRKHKAHPRHLRTEKSGASPFPVRRTALRPRTVDKTKSRHAEERASEVRASEDSQDSSACPEQGPALSGRSISDGTFNGADS